MLRASLALCLVLLLALTVFAKESTYWWENAPPPVHHGRQMPTSWWKAAKQSAKDHGCSPFDIVAVMIIESGPRPFRQDKKTVGRGRNGRKYIRPMGFNRYCNIPEDVMYTPEKQIYWAGKLLAGNLRKRLKSYNAKWYKNHYIRDVIRTSRKLQREAKEQIRLQKYGF